MNKNYLANIVCALFMLSNTIELKPCQSPILYSVFSGIGGYFFGTSLQNALRYRQYQQVTECRLRCLNAPENTKEDREQYLEIEKTFKDKDALSSGDRSYYYSYILKDIKDKECTLPNWNHSVQKADKKIKNFMNDN